MDKIDRYAYYGLCALVGWVALCSLVLLGIMNGLWTYTI